MLKQLATQSTALWRASSSRTASRLSLFASRSKPLSAAALQQYSTEVHTNSAESYADKLKKKLAKESSSLDEKTTNSLLGFLGTLDEEGNATTGQQIASSPFDPELTAQEYTINEVLQIMRHVKVTPGLRVQSFASLVLLGTGKGSAGLGYGKGETVAKATEQATRDAQKNIMSINIVAGGTLTKDIQVKYKRSYVLLKAVRPGYGMKASPELRTILKAFGIKDASVVTFGSRNKITLYRAVFKALKDGIQSPEDIARMTGKKLFNKSKAWYFKNE
jgi:ribosomal protein S5